MKYFWTHKYHIPAGQGFGQFSRGHFLWLAVSVLFVAVISFVYKTAGAAERIVILRTIAACLIGIDVLKLILIHYAGVDVTEFIPLEICSFAAYSIVFDSIWPANTFFPGLLITLFLPAAIMAILFPTTATLPAVNFYSIHQFLYHDLIIAYVTARFISGEIPLDYAGVWGSIAKVLTLAACMYVVDTVFHRNFMFLRATEDNPLLEVIWKKTGGGFGYTIGLVCFCIFMIHVFFVFFKCIALLFGI